MLNKIYAFSNGKNPMGLIAISVGEDSKVVAMHICSNESFVQHDLGVTSNWKHELYDKRFGAGNWEIKYLSPTDPLPECLKFREVKPDA